MPACRCRCRGASPGPATLTALPWALLTAVIYVTILIGGFVKSMGRDYTPTLEHYMTGFRIEQAPRGLHFSGIGLEFVLDDARSVRDRRAADRGSSAC